MRWVARVARPVVGATVVRSDPPRSAPDPPPPAGAGPRRQLHASPCPDWSCARNAVCNLTTALLRTNTRTSSSSVRCIDAWTTLDAYLHFIIHHPITKLWRSFRSYHEHHILFFHLKMQHYNFSFIKHQVYMDSDHTVN